MKNLDIKIRDLLKSNGINEMHGDSSEEMIAKYLKLTDEERATLILWYADNQWTVTKSTRTWLDKNSFEVDHFYISGSDAAITMLLLGFKVNHKREVNVSERSMARLARKRRQRC